MIKIMIILGLFFINCAPVFEIMLPSDDIKTFKEVAGKSAVIVSKERISGDVVKIKYKTKKGR